MVERIALSRAQLGVYFEHLRDETGRAFNIGQVTRIEGPLDIDRFRQAARSVIASTAALNMSIRQDEHGPHQVFVDRRETEIPYF